MAKSTDPQYFKRSPKLSMAVSQQKLLDPEFHVTSTVPNQGEKDETEPASGRMLSTVNLDLPGGRVENKETAKIQP